MSATYEVLREMLSDNERARETVIPHVTGGCSAAVKIEFTYIYSGNAEPTRVLRVHSEGTLDEASATRIESALERLKGLLCACEAFTIQKI
jgi:hypothetical protein